MSSPAISTLAFLGDLVFVDVLVDDPRHRRAQAGQVGTAIRLRNVVGEAEHLFLIGIVPLHGHFNADGDTGIADLGFAGRVENGRMQDALGAVDVFDKALDAAGESEILFLAGTLVDQADAARRC